MTQEELMQKIADFMSPPTRTANVEDETSALQPQTYDQRLPEYTPPIAKPTGIDPNAVNTPENWDQYRAFHDQMMRNIQNDPNFLMSDYLPGGNRYTNINAKSREETLRLSRLADALNNQYFISPRTGSTLRGGLRGQGVVGEQVQYGSLYRMPFETEEMRQMERMRDYERAVRGRDIGRQATALDIQTIEQQRAQYEEYLRTVRKLNEEQVRQHMEMFDYQMGYSKAIRDAMIQRANLAFELHLSRIGIPTQQAHLLNRLIGRYPTLAVPISNLFGAGDIPSPMNAAWYRAQARRYRDDEAAGLSEEEIMANQLQSMIQDIGTLVGEGTNAAAIQLREAVPAMQRALDNLRGKN